MSVKNLATKDDVSNFLDQQNNLLVIKFGAKWCEPCADIEPDFQALASELVARKEQVAFASIILGEENADVFEAHAIVKLPTFVVSEGPETFRMERPSAKELRSLVRSHMPMPALNLSEDF